MKDDKKDILEKFGAHVRDIRNQKGITMLELEVMSGVTEGYISRVENGKRNPALTTIYKLAKGLSVPPSHLLQVFDE